MNRLLGLFVALLVGLWAQRMLTGPDPGLPRDALILFVVAGVIFVVSARPPRVLRAAGEAFARWQSRGRLITLAGLGIGLVALALLWLDLGSIPGLLLWPVATVLFVAGAFLEEGSWEEKETGESREKEETDVEELGAVSAAVSSTAETRQDEPANTNDRPPTTDHRSRFTDYA
ncbi:MAG: tripartite tricarboxylate transporter TctB family protein, partial [Anaerolineae bacterium]|nr:tripartite tricarboxylate transporter TctB family protein [Anaerolineae bacterium]